MTVFVTIVHTVVCLILIVLVLLQRGKGAEIGAVFGGSAATTLFGSRGAGNFLTKLTTGSAVVFMVTSFYLAYVAVIADQGDVLGGPAASEAAPSPSVPQQATPAGGDYGEVMTEGAPSEPAQPAAEPAPAESAPEAATNPQTTAPVSDPAQ
ncbi:MAG TPA: preprotein translocase subunit SecG [Myxococcota bacterium]|nr:preprotein translocase subunit SecG [Myxococcota bacterium]